MDIISDYKTTIWTHNGARYFYQRARVEDYYYDSAGNPRSWRWFLFDDDRNHIGDFPTLRELTQHVHDGRV